MKQFIKNNFTVIVLVISLISLLKSCNDGRELSKLRKEVTSINDSTYNKKELDVRLQIEGLKSEKRMIQATDRKIMDVNRQTQIEQEIKVLEDKLKK